MNYKRRLRLCAEQTILVGVALGILAAGCAVDSPDVHAKARPPAATRSSTLPTTRPARFEEILELHTGRNPWGSTRWPEGVKLTQARIEAAARVIRDLPAGKRVGYVAVEFLREKTWWTHNSAMFHRLEPELAEATRSLEREGSVSIEPSEWKVLVGLLERVSVVNPPGVFSYGNNDIAVIRWFDGEKWRAAFWQDVASTIGTDRKAIDEVGMLLGTIDEICARHTKNYALDLSMGFWMLYDKHVAPELRKLEEEVDQRRMP